MEEQILSRIDQSSGHSERPQSPPSTDYKRIIWKLLFKPVFGVVYLLLVLFVLCPRTPKILLRVACWWFVSSRESANESRLASHPHSWLHQTFLSRLYTSYTPVMVRYREWRFNIAYAKFIQCLSCFNFRLDSMSSKAFFASRRKMGGRSLSVGKWCIIVMFVYFLGAFISSKRQKKKSTTLTEWSISGSHQRSRISLDIIWWHRRKVRRKSSQKTNQHSCETENEEIPKRYVSRRERRSEEVCRWEHEQNCSC